MPYPWKKPPQPSAGLSRLFSGLRHDGGGSSLVVQTGFPTSLADLVVKNCDRLRKPSSRKKPYSDLRTSASDAVASTMSVLDFGPSPFRLEDRRCRHGTSVVSGNSSLRGAACVRLPAPDAAGQTKRRGFGLFWSGLLMVNLFILAGPAIDRRNLAAGITLAAFGLWIVDTSGFRVFRFLPPCANGSRSSKLASATVDFFKKVLISPIRDLGNERLVSTTREVGNKVESFSCTSIAASEQSKGSPYLIEAPKQNKSCPDLLMESEKKIVCSIDLNQEKKKSWKRKCLGAISKVCAAPSVGSSRNSKGKTKKLFGKLLPKKLRWKNNGKDANAFASDLSSREISNSIIGQKDEAIDGDGSATTSTDDALSFIASESVSNCVAENLEVSEKRVCGAKCIGSQLLACCSVILLGLLGGKTLALVLTVTWFLFGKSTQSLRKKRMDSIV